MTDPTGSKFTALQDSWRASRPSATHSSRDRNRNGSVTGVGLFRTGFAVSAHHTTSITTKIHLTDIPT